MRFGLSKVESNVTMADWTSESLMGCEGIISSCCLHGARILIGGSLLHAPFILGPLRMPTDSRNSERLLTEQCSHPDLGVNVLVQARFPFPCSRESNGQG